MKFITFVFYSWRYFTIAISFTFVLLTSLYLWCFQLANLLLAFLLFGLILLLLRLVRPRQEHVQLSLLLIVKLHHLRVAVHYVSDLSALVCLRLESALARFVIGLQLVHHSLPRHRVVAEHEFGALLWVYSLDVYHTDATA